MRRDHKFEARSLEQRAFALRHLYVYPRLRIAYTYIPKNACTSLKRTFGLAQGWLPEDDPHAAHKMKASWWLRGLASAPWANERMAVIREPADRVLSAFLNRFLMRNDHNREQAMANGLTDHLAPGATADDVTFVQFVEYLAATPNARLGDHWRPQRDFLIGHYTRPIRFDLLAAETAYFTRLGVPLEARVGHSTSAFMGHVDEEYWGDQPAARLRALRRRRQVLPAAESMYTPRLRHLVRERFADDYTIYEALGQPS